MAKSWPSILLRFIALGASISAAVVMITSHDSVTILNLKFEANYTNSPTYMYFVIANAIAGVYSLVLLFLPVKNKLWRLILVLDLVIFSLLISSVSAALAIGYVGKKGNPHAGWLPICGQVSKFCNYATGALISGFAATVIYFILLLYSLHNVINLLTVKTMFYFGL